MTPIHVLSNNGLCLHTAARVTIFSTGGKFGPVSNFTELHALTQVAHSYVLLYSATMHTGTVHTAWHT